MRAKRLAQDLRMQVEQLHSFRTLIEDTYLLISIQSIDISATFLYANSVFFRALNYVPQDLIGVRLLELAHPQDKGLLERAITQVIDEGKCYLSCAHICISMSELARLTIINACSAICLLL